MKKVIAMMVLVSGISNQCIAQEKTPAKANDIFTIPEAFINYRFNVDLGKGNAMQLELSNTEDMHLIKNIDSIIAAVNKDLIPLKDSLADDLAAKRIDHLTDLAGRKKIRITVNRPASSTYVIQQGEIAALRSEQDTLNIIGMVNGAPGHTLLKPLAGERYFRISFFLNSLAELADLSGNGLGEKMTAIGDGFYKKWRRNKSGEWYLKSDRSVTAARPAGNAGNSQDYLTLVVGANLQNYKNIFVPSFSLGIQIIVNSSTFKRTVSSTWDPHFLFAKNAAGNLQTFRNDFYTLRYSQERLSAGGRKNTGVHINPDISFSWLKYNRGVIFEKNTFRLGLGQFNISKDRISIEPGMYFTGFFKHATPGIKIGFSF